MVARSVWWRGSSDRPARALRLRFCGSLSATRLKTLSERFQKSLTTCPGTLKISDVSVFDSGRGTFAGIGFITGGTGRFAGATGDVFTTGRTPDGLSFTTDMTATICFPQ